MNRLFLFGIAVLALGMPACRSNGPGPAADRAAATPPASLRNTRWVLRQLEDAPIQLTENSRELDLLLESEGSRVRGNAGCNRYSGTFEQPTPEQLRFSKLLSTRMACPMLDTETRFLAVLGRISYFRISGDTLRLYAGPPAEAAALARLEAVYTQ
ncbi:hypothetical protein GCM10027048_16510 [Hymenobacter coalescens]